MRDARYQVRPATYRVDRLVLDVRYRHGAYVCDTVSRASLHVEAIAWLKKLFPEPAAGAFTFDSFIADATASSVRNQGDIYFVFSCFFDWARGDKQRIKSRSKGLNLKRAATLMAVCLQPFF